MQVSHTYGAVIVYFRRKFVSSVFFVNFEKSLLKFSSPKTLRSSSEDRNSPVSPAHAFQRLVTDAILSSGVISTAISEYPYWSCGKPMPGIHGTSHQSPKLETSLTIIFSKSPPRMPLNFLFEQLPCSSDFY